ncbi:hypothetical protein PV327_007412 [Microctonus hyperodae]|uniref:Post-GPI attachment to proteins factor 3 n=1 Tax=Microctonus hyperodae TaxID=165561 RepID=A0AA39FZT6_MICHY|nr:hypothetical protein PV327_007412 [Microctonus hyperodae]
MLKPMFLVLLIPFMFGSTSASTGDRSRFHRQCIIKCYSINCVHNVEFEVMSFNGRNLLSWSCEENCRYNCMWETVGYFTYHKLQVPQFYGKWPFIRMCGFQEPASVIFSLLNFYAHIIMYKKLRKEIRFSMPMTYIWSYFTIVCLNCWFWSAMFHARDKPFTEAMDYSGAFLMVVTLLYCMVLRLYYGSNLYFFVTTCVYITVLVTHLSHLWSENINYAYNMKINIFYGFLTFITTMIWWYRNFNEMHHISYIGWFNILTVTVTLLELADFSPLLWVFDAHAMWHASTAPLVYLLYRFIIADCHYLRRQRSYEALFSNHQTN